MTGEGIALCIEVLFVLFILIGCIRPRRQLQTYPLTYIKKGSKHYVKK